MTEKTSAPTDSVLAAIDALAVRCGFPVVENRVQLLDTVGNLVARLRAERDELRTVLNAWHSAFGTTQLTHALSQRKDSHVG